MLLSSAPNPACLVLTSVLKTLSRPGRSAFFVEGEAECKCGNDSGQFSIFGAIEEIRVRRSRSSNWIKNKIWERLRRCLFVRVFADALCHANAAMELVALLSTGLAQEMQNESRAGESRVTEYRTLALTSKVCCWKVCSWRCESMGDQEISR